MKSEAEKAEEAGKRGDAKTLCEITRKLSGRFQNTCKPVRNKAGVLLRSAERRCTGGGSTLKHCLTTRICSTCHRWSQMTSLTSEQVASHVLRSRMLQRS